MAGAAGIQSGPMLGYASMAEVLVWVQTDSPGEVKIAYWPVENPSDRRWTEPVSTGKKTAFIAKCVADRVSAGKRYGYAVYIDDVLQPVHFREAYQPGEVPLTFHTPPNWRFRQEGHAPFDFTVGFGSCAYINEPEGGYDRMNGSPYGADYQVFESVYEVNPDLFIWLGDNVYYREPDWSSRTGMIHRWTHDRSIPELRGMMATIPQYGTWDDHDFGPNDIGREFWNKAMATEIFTLFQGNPTAGLPETPGIFTYFAWGDVHFYLTDNRTYRTVRDLNPGPYGYQKQMLGKKQIDWMIELMKYNRNQSASSYPCTFHVVAMGNQVLSGWSRDGMPNFEEEWQYLFDRLVDEEIHNVIFLSGDVHHSEASRMVYTGGGQPGTPGKAGEAGKDYVFWDITSSPMSAGPNTRGEKPNPHRVDLIPGERDHVAERNFATLTFEGPLRERRAVIRYYDSNGLLLNQDPGGQEGAPTPASIISSRELSLHRSLYP
jgi:alkaline phosphatase D